MKTNYYIVTFILLSFLLGASATHAQSDEQELKEYQVYKFDIKENIAPPVWRTTKMAIEEAQKMEADIVLIHMNTYGGMVDAASGQKFLIAKYLYMFLSITMLLLQVL